MPFKTFISCEKIKEKHDQLCELPTKNWNQRMQYGACQMCAYPASYEDFKDYTPIARWIIASISCIMTYIASVIVSIEDERFLKPVILGVVGLCVFPMAVIVYFLLKTAMFIAPYLCYLSLATIFASSFFVLVGLVAFAIYTYKKG